MNIPEQVKKAAKGLGTHIDYLGEHNGEQVYEVYTPDKNGVGLETGFPILVFFAKEEARLEISDDNLTVLMELNPS